MVILRVGLDIQEWTPREWKNFALRFPTLELRQCKTGWGLFAKVGMPAYSAVGIIDGIHVFDRSYQSDYCMDTGIGLLEPAAPFGYANHSCTPNCQFEVEENHDERGRKLTPTLVFWTIQEIGVGEELTIDYGWPVSVAKVNCQCGSAKCRGTINRKQRAKQPRQRKRR